MFRQHPVVGLHRGVAEDLVGSGLVRGVVDGGSGGSDGLFRLGVGQGLGQRHQGAPVVRVAADGLAGRDHRLVVAAQLDQGEAREAVGPCRFA